jgi:peptidoglycan/LPS O-acetylase OafA/YrhL
MDIFSILYSKQKYDLNSGLLKSYIILKYTEGRAHEFSKIGFLISRFIRLTPQLVIFMLLTSLIPILSSGPIWALHISPIVNNCYNNWWQNLLYVQTFFDTEKMVNRH